ncbi:MAG: FGGY family carbohydrate kinase, partial [Solirubrobacterales bacterium]
MILAIDQGTTGTTCLVFDERGRIAGRGYSELEQYFPRPGWVEHDAGEIWDTTRRVANLAIVDAGIQGADLKGIGITNQRETVVAWDPETGEPVHRALVWQDRRTAQRCDELRQAGHEELVRERTGLVIDPYFSATKIEWMLRNVEGADAAVFG